ncbi:MAG: tRNA (N(6)-L-threonylcarbamoyladenosine(37)-C(2))-methylthiotransferase [Candidatus Njordarchaeales archaeon]
MPNDTQKIRVAVITTGCAVNQAYSEILMGLLTTASYELVENPAEADLIIINACAIKKPTEDRMLALIKRFSEGKKKIIASGCLAELVPDRIKKIAPNASIIGAYNLMRIPEIIPRVLRGEIIELLERQDFEPLLHPRILLKKYIGVVPIARGCVGHCTYCVDKRIWGELKSYPKEKILQEIRRLLSRGVKEIRLSGQDTGPYGWDLGYTLVDLLRDAVEIPGDFRIRIGMMSPDTAIKIIDDLLDLMKHTDKIYKYLHIPVQSGSNRVLRRMNRKYTVEDFIDLIKKIRKELGFDTTIATDIITGFPGETEEDHKASIELLEKVKPDIVNLSRYGDRPGVPSSKLYPKIHSRILKRRSRELTETIRRISFERNREYIGKVCDVLLLEKDGNSLRGRLYNYKLVITRGNDNALGKWVKLRIAGATWKTLHAAPLEFVPAKN